MAEQNNQLPSYFEATPPPPYEAIYNEGNNFQPVVVNIDPPRAHQNANFFGSQSVPQLAVLPYPPACTCLAWSSFFFGCFPIGAFAIYYSNQVKSATKQNDLATAVQAYILTKRLSYWSFSVLSMFLIICIGVWRVIYSSYY
ncbi:uncharacterized protein LOC100212920 [Hydra vulgaris]|uniref:uncharacterized protein LOC100212920 n=1 Tax=Hydra vulgaris TaxID=6087 RepID=UPI0006416A7E|nr:uncharacterized protein LOC100212920 [Hydra vulgaris]